MTDCTECGFTNPSLVGVVVCRNCGAKLSAKRQDDGAAHAAAKWLAIIRSSVAASIAEHRLLWGSSAILVLGSVLVLLVASFVSSWSSVSTEASTATVSRYQDHLRPLIIDITDGWNDIDKQDIPEGLATTKVCCDGLGREMVRFEAALPPIRIEATSDRVAEIINDINEGSGLAGFLDQRLSKSGPPDEPLGRYNGYLRSPSVGWWQVTAEVTENSSGDWVVHLVFQTTNI